MISIKIKIIKDPVHGDIECSPLELQIIDSPQFQRLRKIKQLGLAELIYPSANHTRYEHSLGVMHLAGKLGHALNLKKRDIEHIRLAGLLHDIGHLPFSHTLESVLSNGKGHIHENNGITIINEQFSELLKDNNMDKDTITNLILGKGQFGKILSSGVDIDKMDYILRDSYFTGVAYGVIDISRLMYISLIDGETFAFHKKGLTTVESVILARMMMYSAIYDYPAKRAAERMLFRALDAMDRRSLNITKLVKMDDTDLLSILRQQKGYPKDIICRIDQRKLFKKASMITKDDIENEKILRCIGIRNNINKLTNIENKIAEQLNIPKGYLIIDIMSYPKGIEQIHIKDHDGTISKLKEVSPLSRSLMRQKWQDWKISIFCPKEYRNIAKGNAKELFLKYMD